MKNEFFMTTPSVPEKKPTRRETPLIPLFPLPIKKPIPSPQEPLPIKEPEKVPA